MSPYAIPRLRHILVKISKHGIYVVGVREEYYSKGFRAEKYRTGGSLCYLRNKNGSLWLPSSGIFPTYNKICAF
jgi:hypothetical protein